MNTYLFLDFGKAPVACGRVYERWTWQASTDTLGARYWHLTQTQRRRRIEARRWWVVESANARDGRETIQAVEHEQTHTNPQHYANQPGRIIASGGEQ